VLVVAEIVRKSMNKVVYAAVLLVLLAGSFLAGSRSSRAKSAVAHSDRTILYYVDPMHPAYKSERPGKAPDCGMELVPVYADQADLPAVQAQSGSLVRIDRDKQQLIGIRTETVVPTAGSRQLRVLGRAAADDRRVYRVNAGVDGWIREVLDSSLGSYVRKDQRLATFYSPDFVALEQGFLVASERTAAGMKPQQAAPGTQSSAARLRNLGMGDAQIQKVAETRQLPENVDIVSPVDGYLVARNVYQGERFERGTEFYRIADLSQVWVIADVAESDAVNLRPGTPVVVRIPPSERALNGRVSEVLPQVDRVTGGLKLRVEVANPRLELRPDMLVEVDLPLKIPAGISVPADAVVDSGESKRVFLETAEGVFEPREVVVEDHFGDRVLVRKGLALGDRVVVSGTFLLDSETRLRESAGQIVNLDSAKASSASAKMTSAASKSVVDPACGRKVNPRLASTKGLTISYVGSTFYFCSDGCKKKFLDKPEEYIATAGGEGRD
jgi:multidrug efflux pump subunit AcrA (membrane-fusion protein)/YHS domain-containing protein